MIRTGSPIVRLGVQAASPLALVVAIFLFFGGHNNPGGGFAAGLVLGAVLALRTVAGLQRPVGAQRLLVAGGLIAAAVALAPVVFGDLLLDQKVVETTLPVLGKVKSGSAAVFDLGVTLIVVGLVMAVLDGLGAADLADEGNAADRAPGDRVSGDPVDRTDGEARS